MSSLVFLRQFSKNWREVGSVVPSSPFLVKKMLSKVDFESARLVVELGPGTGPVTKEILLRLHPEGRLVVVESNASFCLMLRRFGDPRLRVECISAEDLAGVLGGEKADAIVSGLPLAVIDRRTVRRVLAATREALSPDGVFVQFQYSLASKKLLHAFFEDVSIGFTPINIPPAFVYVAQNTSL